MATAAKTLPQSKLHTTDSVFTPLALRGKKKAPQVAPVAVTTKRAEPKSLPELRSKKRKLSDACLKKHVGVLEQLAFANGGYVPTYKWLNEHGYFSSYSKLKDYPAAFAHLKQETDKKFEIYEAHNTAQPEILPPERAILAPAKYKSIADYDISGARFSPTELRISEGLDEQSWMQLGRALAHICMSTYWWIGDFINYGRKHYGVKVSYDLARQATGFTQTALYHCVRVAKRYPPERRVEALTFYHHSILAKFLPELSDKLLSEAVEYGYTARQIRKMADEATGVPEKEAAWKAINVVLPVADYQALHGHCNGLKETKSMGYRRRVEWLASKIIDEWLREKERMENDGTTLAAD
jgi:hypothetical protein